MNVLEPLNPHDLSPSMKSHLTSHARHLAELDPASATVYLNQICNQLINTAADAKIATDCTTQEASFFVLQILSYIDNEADLIRLQNGYVRLQ